jgi:hypothetical protein
MLVLIMVLYHWMNYFVRADGSIYRYLRFLTPSFIFITGFLISTVYLRKYQVASTHIAGRLIVRGVKLLAIVFCLNLGQNVVHLNGSKTVVGEGTFGEIVMAALTGMAPIAFSVLIPIGYLLILSAALFGLSRYYKNTYHLASIVVVGLALILEVYGIQSGYLQLVGIGMLGISIGYVSIDRIHEVMKDSIALLAAYVGYLAVITFWNDVYLIQIIGVCLSLAIIYRIGLAAAKGSTLGSIVTLLGKYSLFGYIAQILILQLLRRTFYRFDRGILVASSAFVICAACTILSVWLLDRTRGKVDGINKLYAAVFC